MQEILKPEVIYYQLAELIGEGLSSCVYKATRTDSRGHSSQVVALKMLKSQKHVELLKNEFAALCRIRSAHCVSVLSWENFGNNSALVLEFVDGVSLEQLTADQNLSISVINEVTRQIQLGLEHLRDQGLCHGDLSPSNVLIDPRGIVRLVDFGLANWSARENFGTPDFLAPERWQGQPPNFYSDLYALGMIRKHLQPSLTSESLLHPDPQARELLVMCEERPLQEQMGQLVRETIQRRGQRPIVTQLLATVPLQAALQPRVSSPHALLQILRLCAVIGTLLMPLAPRGQLSAMVAPATLEIRSERWLRASVNNHDLGYAPIRVRTIYPGRYKIKWRAATSSGEREISFSMGEHKILTEADFLSKPDT